MNLQISIVILFFALIGCGVKGDPVPPETGAYIGRGQPTFKGAAEDVRLQQQKIPELDRSEADDREREELEKRRLSQ